MNLVEVDCETARGVEPPGALRAAEVLGLLVREQDALVLERAVAVLGPSSPSQSRLCPLAESAMRVPSTRRGLRSCVMDNKGQSLANSE